MFCKKSNVPDDNYSINEEDTLNNVKVLENTKSVNTSIQLHPNFALFNHANNRVDNVYLLELINFSNDIGTFIDNNKIDDHTKFRLLISSWKLESSFKFPFFIYIKNDVEKKNCLRVNHFDNYPWLIYSESHSDLYCKVCVLFLVHKNGGKCKNVLLQKGVTKPSQEFAKLLGKDGCLKTQCKTEYHKETALSSNAFLNNYVGPSKQAISLINTQRMKKVNENREHLNIL